MLTTKYILGRNLYKINISEREISIYRMNGENADYLRSHEVPVTVQTYADGLKDGICLLIEEYKRQK